MSAVTTGHTLKSAFTRFTNTSSWINCPCQPHFKTVLKDAEEFVYIGTWITGYRLERPAICQEATCEEEQVARWLVARAVTPASSTAQSCILLCRNLTIKWFIWRKKLISMDWEEWSLHKKEIIAELPILLSSARFLTKFALGIIEHTLSLLVATEALTLKPKWIWWWQWPLTNASPFSFPHWTIAVDKTRPLPNSRCRSPANTRSTFLTLLTTAAHQDGPTHFYPHTLELTRFPPTCPSHQRVLLNDAKLNDAETPNQELTPGAGSLAAAGLKGQPCPKSQGASLAAEWIHALPSELPVTRSCHREGVPQGISMCPRAMFIHLVFYARY